MRDEGAGGRQAGETSAHNDNRLCGGHFNGCRYLKHAIEKWGLILGSATTPQEYWYYCDANDICVAYEVVWHDRGLKGMAEFRVRELCETDS